MSKLRIYVKTFTTSHFEHQNKICPAIVAADSKMKAVDLLGVSASQVTRSDNMFEIRKANTAVGKVFYMNSREMVFKQVGG